MGRRILLVSTVCWPSVARYAGGFAAAGCEVHAFSPGEAPVAASRYVTQHHLYSAFTPIFALRQAVERSACDLLVACDDRAVAILLRLANIYEAFAPLVARSLGRLENYSEMLSRNGSLAAMRAAGVHVPDTFAVSNEDELEDRLSQIGFPAVIKADGSWGGEGVAIARERAAAVQAYRRLAAAPSRLRSLARALKRHDAHFAREALAPVRRAISLQRFIPGTPAASAFASWQGKVVAAIHYDVLVAEGTIGPPNVIRRLDDPAIEHASHAVAQRFGLSGLHGLDFIRDGEGTVHLIEINPRCTQGGTLAFGPGRDLPSALASAAFGTMSGMRPAIANDTVVLFPREWQRSATSEWLRLGHHDVPWDDPAVLRAALGMPATKRRA
ncbi:MAG: ATP-grasp domain-containing protein [Proteobacteria bacterium]|nr:ATP-grasp domain-containing protein [Pseudomonadota bacterium]